MKSALQKSHIHSNLRHSPLSRRLGPIIRVGLILTWIFSSAMLPAGRRLSPHNSTSQHSDRYQNQASELLERLSPEEKVGQLFLISFSGQDADNKSQIYDLISNYHIGGVVLRADNNNFIGPEDTLQNAFNLITTLQTTEWQNSQEPEFIDPLSPDQQPEFIPLFIGIGQEGDGPPYSQIINGMTPMPNQMAIGATWQPELAEDAGAVLGRELQALGINLYLGPSLDVLDVLYTEARDSLGTRTFSSDPYWVGQMGQSFINGLHTGSQDQIAVISKHFPGAGGSDRPPEEEVATIRKSLEQLKQIELAPFFAVTGRTQEAPSITDGLLVSHIRYQGFQGNIRVTTRPMSFDQVALEQLLELDEFSEWRTNGGIIISDDLGNAAVRRFYDPGSRSFDARQVARNAFLAGNDLLYMNNIISTGDENSYITITRTLDFFAQKYREDPAFAQKVDLAVERLLTQKLTLYPEFDLDSITPAEENLEIIGQSQQVVFEIAQNSATLISPKSAELNDILPGPPGLRERIVFITDTQIERQCSDCTDQTIFETDALQNAVLKLYGPQAGGQVISGRLSSYSFTHLTNLMDGIVEDSALEDDLTFADWIVFSLRDIDKDRPESLALQRFLTERPNLLREKNIITFAFNAPYFLDATDISNLTAYYGMYSKSPAFIDAAARILFRELTPVGALPVSVPGIGYDIIQATSPNPVQIIPLIVDIETTPPQDEFDVPTEETLEPTRVPSFSVGDTLPLRTGMIYDNNMKQVPDGTPVTFLFTLFGNDGNVDQQVEATTTDGIAHAVYRIQNPGLMEIRVASDPALVSDVLQLDISDDGEAIIITVIPTPTGDATTTPQPTLTPTITPTKEIIATPTPEPLSAPHGTDWLLSILIIGICAAGVFVVSQLMFLMRWGVRWTLVVILGGLISYSYLALGLPGSSWWLSISGTSGILIVTIVGCLLGWFTGWIWHRKSSH
jgi:beta-N-acetylhexosaminidase